MFCFFNDFACKSDWGFERCLVESHKQVDFLLGGQTFLLPGWACSMLGVFDGIFGPGRHHGAPFSFGEAWSSRDGRIKGGFEKRSQGRREDREEGNKDRMSDIGLLKTFFCGSSNQAGDFSLVWLRCAKKDDGPFGFAKVVCLELLRLQNSKYAGDCFVYTAQ